MAHAERCPICDGKGKPNIEYESYTSEKGTHKIDLTTLMSVCHGCGGKGWVEVRGMQKTRLLDILFPLVEV